MKKTIKKGKNDLKLCVNSFFECEKAVPLGGKVIYSFFCNSRSMIELSTLNIRRITYEESQG